MGGAFGKPGGGSITRQQLLASTQNNREFINKLFQLMLTKLTPEDILKLGKAQTCSTYVFFMAHSMGKLFEDLRIRPKKDRDTGVVMFQKLDKLKGDTGDSRDLCLFVAFFFIRIFQIFGAVAMTILDDPSAGQVLGAVKFGAPVSGPAQRPGFFGLGQQKRIPGSRGAYLAIGGAEPKHFMTGKAREFAPIKELLDDPQLETTTRGTPRAVFTFTEAQNINIIPDRINEYGKPQNLRVEIDGQGRLYANLRLQIPLAAVGATTRKLKAEISYFKYVDQHKDAQIVNLINKQIAQYKTTFDSQSADGGVSWQSGAQPFVDKLLGIIQRVLKIIEQIESNPGMGLQNLKLLTKQERALQGFDGASGVRFAAPGLGGIGAAGLGGIGAAGLAARGPVGQRDIAVSKPFHNEYIVNVLKQLAGYKTTAFCVARGLQLLDANTLFQPKTGTATSGICKPVFEATGLSLPQSKQSLEKVPGLKAVDQLFHNQPSLDTRNEFQLKVGDLQAYADFLTQMNTLFGKPTTAQLTALDKVLVKDPNCPTTAVGKYLQIQDPKGIQKVLGVIGRMFARQKTHTEKSIKFLTTRLFKVAKRKDPITGSIGTYVDLSPALLTKGLDELQAVTREARTLLIDYYKGCEDLYQEGVREVLTAKSTPV